MNSIFSIEKALRNDDVAFMTDVIEAEPKLTFQHITHETEQKIVLKITDHP